MQRLIKQLAVSVGRVLERRDLVERDIEIVWLAAGVEPGPLDDLIGYSITCLIAVCPRAGQKLFTLQLLPAKPPEGAGDASGAVRAGGFLLHAGAAIAPR